MRKWKSGLGKLVLIFIILISVLTIQPSSEKVSATGVETPKTVEGMQGVAVPEGSTVSATGKINAGRTTNLAIDGDINTYWNSAGFSDTLVILFPKEIDLSFIQLASVATPSNASVSYTISGYQSGTWIKISDTITKKINNVNKDYAVLEPINVKMGNYSGIKIEASSNKSTWIAIAEVTLGTEFIQDLIATAGDSQVSLNWSAVEIADSYTVKYGTESGEYTQSAIATKDEYGNFVIPGLTNGTTYYFVVSAMVNGVATDYSNEASATPIAPEPTPTATPTVTPEPTIEPTPTATQSPTPEQPTGDRAILVVTMNTGLEKEFDLSMDEVNAFIAWYENKQSGTGTASYAINKHDNNKGPFTSRKDYIIFDKILTFSVDEYSAK
ncbi:fibronectin type III domain-containing protein [Paenibacillus sonchi]|uniref:fibronectin type III domain-containing protein n=1 Tax=Paenibacillus sonchi TaxID=373687 RepID=UPI001E2B3CC5|nr:fibronectin type III domain-containing protein [Paenibacillus sonchi]